MLESNDKNLEDVLREMNYCCGWFARNPKDIKTVAYKALGAYNIFFDSEERVDISEDDFNLLFTSVKFLGSHRSVESKREFIKKYWEDLEQRLVKSGISWNT